MSPQSTYASVLKGTKKTTNTRASYDAAASQVTPTGPKFSKKFLTYLDKCKAYKTITYAFPKSALDHSIRITLGYFNAYMMSKLKTQLATCMPNAVSTEPK